MGALAQHGGIMRESPPVRNDLSLTGEEEVLKPEEAEIPEDWNVPLENDQQDN